MMEAASSQRFKGVLSFYRKLLLWNRTGLQIKRFSIMLLFWWSIEITQIDIFWSFFQLSWHFRVIWSLDDHMVWFTFLYLHISIKTYLNTCIFMIQFYGFWIALADLLYFQEFQLNFNRLKNLSHYFWLLQNI